MKFNYMDGDPELFRFHKLDIGNNQNSCDEENSCFTLFTAV